MRAPIPFHPWGLVAALIAGGCTADAASSLPDGVVVPGHDVVGVLHAVAGTPGVSCVAEPCDGAPDDGAGLSGPVGLAVDAKGRLYVSESWTRRTVRVVEPSTGALRTVAGRPWQVCNAANLPCGDGGPAADARLEAPKGLATDAEGNLYVADGHRIRRVNAATGRITTVAGRALEGCDVRRTPRCGDGGAATEAWLSDPFGVAVGPDGALYVADTGNHAVRRVDADGRITTVAGILGRPCHGRACGDGGPATAARLHQPYAVAFDAEGNLYVADAYDFVVRRVDAGTGRISVFAGRPETPCATGACGDGGPATFATFAQPSGLAVGPDGAVHVVDPAAGAVRRIDPATGMVHTVVGATDGERLDLPWNAVFDGEGRLYVAEFGGSVVRGTGW